MIAYRPEIDGLRAIAVSTVILYHANAAWMPGGFVGVDVFFVISGYLITSLIIKDLREEKFSLVEFYERRTRRIFPALYVVIALSTIAAWFLFLPKDFWTFAGSAVAASLSVSNFFFNQEVNYFADVSQPQPLLHTWSLGVEEQFYIIFPLLLIIIWRLGISRVYIIVGVIAGASLVLAQIGSTAFATSNFYLLPSRIWELFAGSLCALWLSHVSPKTRITDVPLAVVGIAAIIFSSLRFDDFTPFPSLWAVLPVGGTVLFILFARADNLAGKILSFPLFVGIGLISYSAYLWHMPLFIFTETWLQRDPDTLGLVALIGITFVAAWLSWRWIEQPFRNRSFFTRKQIFQLATIAAAILIIPSLFVRQHNGFPDRLPQQALAFYEQGDQGDDPTCEEFEKWDTTTRECNRIDGRGNRNAILVGDSHAMAIGQGLADQWKLPGHNLIERAGGGCGFLEAREGKKDACFDFNEETFQTVLADDATDIVIMASRLQNYLEVEPFDNQEGGKERAERRLSEANRAALAKSRTENAKRIAMERVDQLLEAGKTVVLVYPIPEAGWHVPNHLARRVFYGRGDLPDLSTDASIVEARNRSARAFLDALGDRENLLRVYPEDVLCKSDGRCYLQDGETLLYFDEDHVTREGAQGIAQAIVEILENRQ